MQLIYKDAKTSEIVCQIEVQKNKFGMFEISESNIDKLIEQIQSNIYKTYGFMIDCALYCINDGDMYEGSYDNDQDEPLAFWALVDCAI